ncbi:MAG: peptidase C14 caspase catalytic subunit p20, partial [bacterium]
LKDSNPSVRMIAIKALAEIREYETLRELVNLLYYNDSTEIREVAASAIAALGVNYSYVATALPVALKAKNPDIRYAVLGAMAQLDNAELVEEIILALKDEHPDVRKRAVYALGMKRTDRAIAALLETMRSQNELAEIRYFAGYSLAKIDDLRVVPILIKRLGDEDIDTRVGAIIALSEMKQDFVISKLIAALNNPLEYNDFARESSALILGKIKSEHAIKSLITALTDKCTTVRQRAGEALIKILDFDAVKYLVAALANDDIEVRQTAVFNLAKIKDIRVAYKLIDFLEEATVDGRAGAIVALAEMKDLPVIELLIESLRDPSSNIREAAAITLGRLSDSRAVEPLIELLADEISTVRYHAVEALAKLNDKSVLDFLVKLLNDEEPDVRRKVVETLADFDDEQAIEALRKVVNDPVNTVRDAVKEALSQLYRN